MKNPKIVEGRARRLGFTLAEVLITLAIIGVVAALTIPVVVHNYQKKQYYTKFMKIYNTMSTALSLAAAEHGNPASWDCSDFEQCVDTYLTAYLTNYTKKEITDVFSASDEIHTLAGNNYGSYISNLNTSGLDIIVLSDGSVIIPNYKVFEPSYDVHYVEFDVDVNGSKGPNTMGRDVFPIKYGEYDLKPRIFSDVDLFEEPDYISICCNPEGNAECQFDGISCGERLIKEGKMNY